MNVSTFKLLNILFFVILHSTTFAQNSFTADQLVQPQDLAKKIAQSEAKRPIILNVGSQRNIKSAIEIGILSSSSKQNVFRKAMAKIDKNEEIIIYCGCCKLKECQNIPIALNYVNSLGYNKVKILNLPENLQEDWIDKDYPMN